MSVKPSLVGVKSSVSGLRILGFKSLHLTESQFSHLPSGGNNEWCLLHKREMRISLRPEWGRLWHSGAEFSKCYVLL